MSEYQSIKDMINYNPNEVSFFENKWRVLFQDIKTYKNIDNKYIDLLKTYILCHSYRCSKRDSNPGIEKKMIRDMIEEYKKHSSDADFKEFIKEIILYIYPKTISMFGFPKSIKYCMENPESQNKINKTIEILSQLNIEHFIAYGTLLGYVRDRSLIPYDNDIDIAIKINNDVKSVQDVQNELSKIKSLINSHYDTFWGDSGKGITIIKIGKKGDTLIRIDLFPYWIKNNKVYIWPVVLDGMNISDIYPLKKINFLNNTLNIINNSNKLLEINYGKNWSEPDPLWVFNWDLAKQKLLNLKF